MSDITYTVKYKLVGATKWSALKNIKGDGIVEETKTMRFFIDHNEARYEIPMDGVEFCFSKERFSLIRRNMELEAGQAIPLKRSKA